MTKGSNVLCLVAENGSKIARGIIFVPKNLTAFHKTGIEALVIAVVRGGANRITPQELETLQEKFNGNLEIFYGRSSRDFIVTMCFEMRRVQRLKHCLETLIGAPIIRITAEPEELERVSQAEIGSSLRAA